MPQYDFGTIDPSTKRGSDLAQDLNNWRTAIHSLHSGNTRPPYITQNMVWLDIGNSPLCVLKLYDGNDDIPLGIFDITNDVYSPSNAGLVSDSIADFSGKLGVVRKKLVKNSGYMAVATDQHKLIEFTATATLLLEPATTLGNGWEAIILANGGDVTIDPHNNESINGVSTYSLPNGRAAYVGCDGTGFLALEIADSHTAKLNVAQNFSRSQGVTPVALTDEATIETNANSSNIFTVTLGGNRTLANPTNLVAGKTYTWMITQDATGSRTLAFGSYFKFPGGAAPTLTAGANAIDMIVGLATSTTRLECNAILDFK